MNTVNIDNCDGNDDYIHANYVDGYKQKNAYISTQGPLDETVRDFWQMVWQETILVIAMTIKNNSIAKSGELIDESQLNSSAEELVREGFIEQVESEVEVNDLDVKSEEVKPISKKVVKPAKKK